MDVKEAVEALGISSEGVRKRIKRRTLESEKDPDGKVYVWLDTDRTGSDLSSDRAVRTDDRHPDAMEILREQVDYLRRQLEVWQEEARRKDHIIVALTERIPELVEPAAEPLQSRPETASEDDGRGEKARR